MSEDNEDTALDVRLHEIQRLHHHLDDRRAVLKQRLMELNPEARIGRVSSEWIEVYVSATGAGFPGDLRDGDGFATSGGGYVRIAWPQSATYFKNPNLFAARLCGFENEVDYNEWITTDGTPMCAAITRDGVPCKNRVAFPFGGAQREPKEWLGRHRKLLCARHAPD